MPAFRDLTGLKFGRLTVRSYLGNRAYWCHCDCGSQLDVRACHLVSGHTQSCGCFRREVTAETRTTHGEKKNPLYQRWARMIQRCTNPKSKDWKYYGGRGVIVEPAWLDFAAFLKEMGPSFKPGLTIDRIDPNSNYGPGLCRWATQKEQRHNRRDNAR